MLARTSPWLERDVAPAPFLFCCCFPLCILLHSVYLETKVLSIEEGSGVIDGYVHAAVGPGMGKNAALVALKLGGLGGRKQRVLLCFVLGILFCEKTFVLDIDSRFLFKKRFLGYGQAKWSVLVSGVWHAQPPEILDYDHGTRDWSQFLLSGKYVSIGR